MEFWMDEQKLSSQRAEIVARIPMCNIHSSDKILT